MILYLHTYRETKEGSRMDAEKVERLRSKVVFRAVEKYVVWVVLGAIDTYVLYLYYRLIEDEGDGIKKGKVVYHRCHFNSNFRILFHNEYGFCG